MKNIIEVEETIKVKHIFEVHTDNEAEFDDIESVIGISNLSPNDVLGRYITIEAVDDFIKSLDSKYTHTASEEERKIVSI